MAKPKLELIATLPDELGVEEAKKEFGMFLSGEKPSTQKELDYVEYYMNLLQACAFDERRVAEIINGLVQHE
jgi:hypothetical protein